MMPRGKKPVAAPTKADPNAGRRYYLPGDAVFGGYINLKLDEEHHEAFDRWYGEFEPRIGEFLAETLVDGMAFSLKFDAENDCFFASYSGAGVSGSNERYVLTARSSSWAEALALLVFKHTELMGGSWDDFLPKSGKLRSWG